MKKFTFPLGRVMDWREMLARVEESKLEQIYAELRAVDTHFAGLERERQQSEQAARSRQSATGAELAAHDSFCRFVLKERGRLEGLRAGIEQRIAAQRQVAAKKRRDVKLLAGLKDQRLARWTREFHHEIDAQAEESYLAKWNRR